jgi:dienelactone hydrolase
MLFGNLLPWFIINNIWSSYPRVLRFFTNLRQAEPDLPVFGAGFCWGGKHVTLLARGDDRFNGRPLIDRGFTAHPSLLTLPDDIEKIRLPVSFAIGDKDNLLTPDKVAHILQGVEAQPEEYKGELKMYAECSHGFAIRADNKFEEVAKQAAAAEDQCIEWFNAHLKQLEPVE